MKGKKLFLKNAALLTATSLLLKSAGMFLRVWLSARLLGEGLGLYQLIISVYLLAANPLIGGLSVAVTKVAGEGRRRADRVASAACRIGLPISLLISAGVFFFADFISQKLLLDTRATLSVKILAFSLPFMALSAVWKGYFISRRNTLPHTLSQLTEQAVRIGAVIFFVSLWQNLGIEMMCAAVLLSDLIAEAVSYSMIWIWAIFDIRKLKREDIGLGRGGREVCKVAIPVGAERVVTTSFHSAENLLTPTFAGQVMGGRGAAVESFGVLKGMTMPLLFFPSSFLSVFSTLLIPEMASALSYGQSLRLKSNVSRTFHTVITVSIYMAAFFLFLAKPLGIAVYNNSEAVYMIRVLAPIVPFMYCESIADGLLKGLGQQVRAFLSGLADALIRLILVFILVPIKGMDGFLIIMLISNTLAGWYKVHHVLKIAKIKADISNWILKPITAALIAGAVSSTICGSLGITNNILYIILAGSILTVIYFLLLILTGTFSIKGALTSLKSGS